MARAASVTPATGTTITGAITIIGIITTAIGER
jgi:hypothetical protein